MITFKQLSDKIKFITKEIKNIKHIKHNNYINDKNEIDIDIDMILDSYEIDKSCYDYIINKDDNHFILF